MKQTKILILVLIVISQFVGKQYFAPGWSASRQAGCQWVQVAGQVIGVPLAIEVEDSTTGSWLYADEVPGDYFATAQNLNLGTCAYSINLYVFPAVYPYTYLIFAQWLHAPVQSIKPRVS